MKDQNLSLPSLALLEKAVVDILRAIGEDPEREGLKGTPRRLAQFYQEAFSGIARDPREVLTSGFEEGYQGTVMVRDIPFFSLCEHHLLPFHGVAHIGYLCDGRVVGISKLAQALDILARRPQIQERLTDQLADAINEAVHPRGVGVVLQAEHLCLTLRDPRKGGSLVVTSTHRGVFDMGEFLALLNLKEG